MADVPDDDALDDATRSLYSVAPEDFMARRGELVEQLRADGDARAAQQIAKLRKPTVAAWIVNVLALEDPAVVDRLTELGDRLRTAQDRLDAAALRDLSAERRKLVAELSKQAFARAGKRQPPAGLRDEVNGTLEAAIADPEAAGRLGRLQRAEHWSGFGFLPTGAPELTLVRGGKDARKAAPAKKTTSTPKKSPAERRREAREVARAQSALEQAESAFTDAQANERELSQRAKQLAKKISKLQDELDGTRDALEAARKDVTSTRSARREARTALDRAEREARD